MLAVLCPNPEPDVCKRRRGSSAGTTLPLPLPHPLLTTTLRNSCCLPLSVTSDLQHPLISTPCCSLNHKAGTSIRFNTASEPLAIEGYSLPSSYNPLF